MNKPFVSAVLVLALSACTDSAPVSTAQTTAAPQAAAPLPKDTASMRADRMADAKRQMSAFSDVDPKTDQAIDNILGNHVAYHKAITAFQQAIAANDPDAVASMVRYPMTFEFEGQKVVVENAGRFKQYYPELFTPQMTKAIVDSKYSQVLIAQKGVLLGDGQTWLSGSCDGKDCSKMDVKILTIQPKASN